MRLLRRLVLLYIALSGVAMGSALMLKRRLRRVHDPAAPELSLVSIFEGTDLRSTSQSFRGGEVWSVYGGTRLDLRRARLDGLAHLRVTTVLGGTEITVPDGWLVTAAGPTFAGGVDLAVPDAAALPTGAPRLVLETRTVLGGVRVVARPVIDAA